MTNPLELQPFISRQSASTPIVTNLLRDEFDAVATVEKEATSQQRVVAIGNSIPIVYGKFENNVGGIWVSPPAAKYGLQITDTLGNSFSLGLVISDGEIGPIELTDIYKGAFNLNSLNNVASVFEYGAMPTAGFNYTFSSTSTTPGTPAIPATPDTVIPGTDPVISIQETQDTQSKSQRISRFTGGIFTGTAAKMSCTAIVVNPDTGVTDNFLYDFSVNLTTIDRSSPFDSTGVSSRSFSFDNGTTSVSYSIAVRPPSGQDFEDSSDRSPSFNLVLSPFSASTFTEVVINPGTPSTTIPGTPGTPATPDTYTTVGLPLYPGDGGSFAGMSCLAVRGTYTIQANLGDFKEQVRCFVRNGIKVYDISTGTTESSSNFLNLAYYLLKKNNIPDSLIDLDSFLECYTFTEANNMFFNGVVNNPVNLRDYLTRVGEGFLLRLVQNNGKLAFRPVLPVLPNGAFNNSSVPEDKIIDLNDVIGDSLSIEYIPAYERKPFCALVSWREQLSQAYSVAVSSEVKYANTAVDGPFEQYDFSDFVTNRLHSELVAKYILASRKHVTHSVSFSLPLDTESTSQGKLVGQLKPLDIIRLEGERTNSLDGAFRLANYYQISSISESAAGEVQINANHFPTDEGGASLIVADILASSYSVT